MARTAIERLVDKLPWLESVDHAVQTAVEDVLEAGGDQASKAKDTLHGRWLGHPLHPALVALPLGAWSSSVMLDLAGQEAGADLTLGLGVVGSALAALAGTADWSETQGDDRRIGTLHGLLNCLALGMNLGSLGLRMSGRRGAGRALSLAAFGVVNASAYLGGELAYTRGVGVSHVAWQEPPSRFTPVCDLVELEQGVPARRQAKGVPVVLVRQGARICALGALCPHAGGPLDEGTVEDGCLTCPWHDSSFSLEDGSVRRGPAVVPAVHFETRIRAGKVEVRAN
jgi:nitrite reductase/ring-hydroxylating ferredoxin subunit/uncharacterized membrane protein